VFTNYSGSSSDYNGFRPNPGVESSFQWVAPPRGVVADYPAPGHTPTLETRRFATLAEYSQATGQDRNSILVDFDIFVNVPRLDAQETASVQKLYRAEDFDFRLKPDAAATGSGRAGSGAAAAALRPAPPGERAGHRTLRNAQPPRPPRSPRRES
jgi:hypothetical protein